MIRDLINYKTDIYQNTDLTSQSKLPEEGDKELHKIHDCIVL